MTRSDVRRGVENGKAAVERWCRCNCRCRSLRWGQVFLFLIRHHSYGLQLRHSTTSYFEPSEERCFCRTVMTAISQNGRFTDRWLMTLSTRDDLSSMETVYLVRTLCRCAICNPRAQFSDLNLALNVTPNCNPDPNPNRNLIVIPTLAKLHSTFFMLLRITNWVHQVYMHLLHTMPISKSPKNRHKNIGASSLYLNAFALKLSIVGVS